MTWVGTFIDLEEGLADDGDDGSGSDLTACVPLLSDKYCPPVGAAQRYPRPRRYRPVPPQPTGIASHRLEEGPIFFISFEQ